MPVNGCLHGARCPLRVASDTFGSGDPTHSDIYSAWRWAYTVCSRDLTTSQTREWIESTSRNRTMKNFSCLTHFFVVFATRTMQDDVSIPFVDLSCMMFSNLTGCNLRCQGFIAAVISTVPALCRRTARKKTTVGNKNPFASLWLPYVRLQPCTW